MKQAFRRLFGSRSPSKQDAKKRLKLLLIHDQIDLTPSEMEDMKAEIVDVIRKYLEVDGDRTTFELDRSEEAVQLVSTVPVSRIAKKSAS